jgi:hypothetical protein
MLSNIRRADFWLIAKYVPAMRRARRRKKVPEKGLPMNPFNDPVRLNCRMHRQSWRIRRHRLLCPIVLRSVAGGLRHL